MTDLETGGVVFVLLGFASAANVACGLKRNFVFSRRGRVDRARSPVRFKLLMAASIICVPMLILSGLAIMVWAPH